MSLELDGKSLDQAFEGRPDLTAAIRNASAGQFTLDTFNHTVPSAVINPDRWDYLLSVVYFHG